MLKKNFNSVLIIGMGLIGSSLSRAIYKNHLAANVFGIDTNEDVVKKCEELNLLVKIDTNILFIINLTYFESLLLILLLFGCQ